MREFLSTIPDLLLPLLHMVILQRCMTAFLGSGTKTLLGYVGWTLYYGFLCATGFAITFPPQSLLTSNLILVFMISTVTRRKKIQQRCIFSLLICAVWISVEAIVTLVLEFTGADATVVSIAGNLISKICMLLFSILLSLHIEEKHYPRLSLRYFLIILLIPAGSLYIVHYMLLIRAVHEEYTLFAVITNLLLLLIHYMVFEIYSRVSRVVELQARNQLYEQQLELYCIQAEKQENLHLEIRRIRHDLKNHLSILLGMIRAGGMDEAEKYIQDMLDDGIGRRADKISYSGNMVVDTLINHKYALAQKDGIDFATDVFIPASLPFHGKHLTIILGNLLDNALEACQKVPQEQRYISLKLAYIKEMLQICICNSCLPGHNRQDSIGRYLTTKEDKRQHGIGLYSVEQAASCYQGEVAIKDTGNEFQVTVVLYRREED